MRRRCPSLSLYSKTHGISRRTGSNWNWNIRSRAAILRAAAPAANRKTDGEGVDQSGPQGAAGCAPIVGGICRRHAPGSLWISLDLAVLC